MAVGSHSLPFAWLPTEPLHFCQHGAGPAGVWEDPNVHLHPVRSLGQNPKHTGVGLCQFPALSRAAFHALANPQGQPGQQASELQMVSPMSESQSQSVSPTGVSPQDAFGTRSLDRSSHDQPGGLYKPVSMVLA